jgi:two-component system chemotaxis sensor kinase CheA
MEDLDVIREFLAESHENLSRLDQEIVELEKKPGDRDLLDSIFRCIHTIKGTCGFFAFSTLEKITHQAESLLSQLRDGSRQLEPRLISLILETVDATRAVLIAIEETGREGTEAFDELTERLRKEVESGAGGAALVTCQPRAMQNSADPQKDAGNCESPPNGVEAPFASAIADANVRVGVILLDKLMDLVGELVLARNQILQFDATREDSDFNATSQKLNLITSELQEGVMKTRMQPIGSVWTKLPRLVRDISVSLGKQVQFHLEGAETELDRTIIEAIKDPLVHLVRNACDHGIELPDVRVRAGKPAHGTLTLRAFHEGGQVNIELLDDGAGIDVQRVKQKAIEKGLLRAEDALKLSERDAFNLIFQPGFSTAAAVTNVSGRGVGMDVVKSNIEKIGGAIDLNSRAGEGTSIKLRIPLTLAIIPGLVVGSGGERFVIPQGSLVELLCFDAESVAEHIDYVGGTAVCRRRGSLLPIVNLNHLLGIESRVQSDAVCIVVVQAEDRQFGLWVDDISDTQEIVVKPLGKQLKNLSVYAGATIMGDGRVALILDVPGVGQYSGVLSDSQEHARRPVGQQPLNEAERQSLLLFDCGSFQRLALPVSHVARLEEFPLSSIERAGGRQAVQYRGQILPLVSLSSILEPDSKTKPPRDPAPAIVLNNGAQSVGIIVDNIIDIAEDSATITTRSTRKGLLGSAIVSQQVTDFLDLDYVKRVARDEQEPMQACGAVTRDDSNEPETALIVRSECVDFLREGQSSRAHEKAAQ